MSLLKFYGMLPLVPLGVNLALLPYRMWNSYRAKHATWDPKETLKNFALICGSKPNELTGRICPKPLLSLVPCVHEGNLGFDTKKKADDAIATLVEVSSIATGAATASIPILRFFGDCLSREGVGACTKAAADDLLSYAGLPLLAGAYLVSRLAKHLIIAPVFVVVSNDTRQPQRLLLLKAEYAKILVALNQALDKPVNDPKFIEAATLAKQFLRLAPHIENEIHASLALDKIQAKEAIMPIRIVCRQLIYKLSQTPPIIEPPKEAAETDKSETAAPTPVKV